MVLSPLVCNLIFKGRIVVTFKFYIYFLLLYSINNKKLTPALGHTELAVNKFSQSKHYIILCLQ